MHIALYTPRVWDSTWGQEKNLVEELAPRHQIVIIDLIDYGMRYAAKLQGHTYPVPEGVAIVRRQTPIQAGILLGIYTEWKNLWDFLKLARRGKADLVITYLTSGVLLTTLAARALGKKIVLIYADDYAEFFRSKSAAVAWFTERIGTPLVTALAHQVVTTAHKLKDDIVRFNPKTTVIPNGVHVAKLRPYQAQQSAEARAFTVGFVGGFGSWVDFEMVLAAAEALPEVQFKLIGSGDQFEDVCAAAQPLTNVWVPGILPYERVLQELAAMDVCLIPFKLNRITDRVSPIKLFEYWAMRKPVISTRFYEVQQVADGKVFFIDTIDELQYAIHRLQQAPEEREHLAAKGFQEVQRYDWTRLGEQYLGLIQDLS